MANPPDYDALQARYDALLKEMIPRLKTAKITTAVNSINQLVQLESLNMTMNLPADPRVILGITADKLVVYGESGRFGSYALKPYDEVKMKVTRMIEKAKWESEKRVSPYPAKISHEGYQKIAHNDLQRAEKLLEDLTGFGMER